MTRAACRLLVVAVGGWRASWSWRGRGREGGDGWDGGFLGFMVMEFWYRVHAMAVRFQGGEYYISLLRCEGGGGGG